MRDFEVHRLHQGPEHVLARARAQPVGHLSLQIDSQIRSHPRQIPVLHPQRPGEIRVHLGQFDLLDALERDRKLGQAAGDALGGVIGRKRQRETRRLPRPHASHRLLESRQHACFAQCEREIARLAAFEGLSVDASSKIDRHAVTVGGFPVDRDPAGALAPNDLDRAVEVGLADGTPVAMQLDLRQVAQIDFGIDLKGGANRDVPSLAVRLRLQPRRPCQPQLVHVQRRRQGVAELFAQHLGLHLGAVRGHHDLHRHLAPAKPRHAGLLRKARQPLRDFRGNVAGRDGQIDAALQSA